jgi:hypothetical protein
MFMETYKKERNQNDFTYYIDWSGFNVPGYVFDPFFCGFFNPLIQCEKNLLEIVNPYRGSRYYVIGTSEGTDIETLEHELSHALWYTNSEYKTKQLENLSEIDSSLKDDIKKHLLEIGYCNEVLDDELHAYITAWDGHLSKHLGLTFEQLERHISKMHDTFKSYSNF